jgi:hypothetical protein
MPRDSRRLVFAAWAVFSACGGEAPQSGGGLQASFETEDTVLSALLSIPVELVEGRTGPGGRPFYVARRTAGGTAHLSGQIGTETFRLGLRVREPELTQYPCASCHQGTELVNDGEVRDGEAAHQNIQPVHPAETGAQCTTCHAYNNVATLTLQQGDTASMDHVYRLCAQCHFSQVDAWAQGAHGKRLVGWRGRRVVMGCTDCHNPHEPAAEPRIPYAGPSLPGALEGSRE